MARELPPITPDPLIEVYKKHVDRTLLRENLKLTVDERFINMMKLQEFAKELHSAGKTANFCPREPAANAALERNTHGEYHG